MRNINELSLMQVQMSETLQDTDSAIKYNETYIQIAEQTICELRDLLTLIKGYKQLIDVKHPEAQSFEHWDEINADMDAMATRLIAYEKQLHTTKINEVA